MAQSSTKEATINKWIKDHPELFYDHASGLIYCSKCEAHLSATRQSNVKRHVEGAVHKGTNKGHLTPLEFYFDLIEFMILCNIPWNQLSNNIFITFFQKYMCCNCKNIKLPDESTLRKCYLDQLFKMKVQDMQNKIVDKKLWLSVDETTDFLGRAVVHLLVRPLEPSTFHRPCLVACKMLKNVNGTTISQFIQDSLKNMWGSFEGKVDNVRMLCTDSAAYMILAGRMLKSTFPKMLHLTCLAHALNLVAGQIREENPNVDTLISNVKKVFLKAPKRIAIFKEMCPDLPLPPAPVITRWGTWLDAAFYYAKHFDKVKSVLSVLNSQEAKSIENALNIFDNNEIKDVLSRIYEKFEIIPTALTALKKSDISLMEAFEVFDAVRLVVRWANCERLENKIEKIMDRNPDLDTIRNISERISSCINDEEEEVLVYKYANLTSVDVERSFSMYKWILNVRRNRLKPENIEKLMVIYFNSNKKYTVMSEANFSNTMSESDKENDSDGLFE